LAFGFATDLAGASDDTCCICWGLVGFPYELVSALGRLGFEGNGSSSSMISKQQNERLICFFGLGF
jgi:hypothetical protein